MHTSHHTPSRRPGGKQRATGRQRRHQDRRALKAELRRENRHIRTSR